MDAIVTIAIVGALILGGAAGVGVTVYFARTYEHIKRQPAGTEVKVYKRGSVGWQLQETVITKKNN